ncbi:MAG: flagellar biosynthetic protein FliO [Candidatus Margulisiibacteriota bacterium]
MAISYYLQVTLSLLVFIGFLFAATRFSKSLQTKRFSCEMKIIDRLAVDQEVALAIVEVRDQQYLMGVSKNNVRILKKLS